MKPKTVAILLALAAVGIGAAVTVTRTGPRQGAATNNDASPQRSPIFPALASASEADLAEIIVKRPEMTFTIRNDNGTWRVADKANHPAKLDTVRQVVVGLTRLSVFEPRTSRPENYAKLGVDDPVAPPPDSGDKPMPQSTLVTIKNAKGEPLASGIIGNQRWEAPQGMFVRRAGESQVYLAEGRFDLPRDPMAWIETKFADLSTNRVKSVEITAPDASTINVSRATPTDTLAIIGIPEGRSLKDPNAGASIGAFLTGVSMVDVAPIASIDFTKSAEDKPPINATLRTFDGLVVNVTSVAKDGKSWWKLAASVDESAVPQPAPPADGTAPAPPSNALDTLKKEAADLNAAWSAYAFAPSDWKARAINTTLNDLLKDPNASASDAQPPAGMPGMPPGMPMQLPPGIQPPR